MIYIISLGSLQKGKVSKEKQYDHNLKLSLDFLEFEVIGNKQGLRCI